MDQALRDGVREEVLDAAGAALRRLAPALPEAADALLRELHAGVPTAELAEMPPEALAEAAASLTAFALDRPPGAAKVRLLPPGPGGGRAVAEVVNDDMPFLVDSALAALALHGRKVHQLLHPVMGVRRDAAGRLLALDPASPGRESLMRITLGGASGAMVGAGGPAPAEDWAAIEAALSRAMADVRAAVADFGAMTARLRDAEAELGEGEARDFLRWMAEDNYVLLGHRRLSIAPDGDVAVEAGENLGLLRDASVPVFDALRDLPALPEAVRANLGRTGAVTVAKANMRSTIHRPQHADVVVTRIADADGRRRARGSSSGCSRPAAYNRNPRSIPLLREKVLRILARAGWNRTRMTAARCATSWTPGRATSCSRRRGSDPGRVPGARSTSRSGRAPRWRCAATRSSASSPPSPGCRATPSTPGCASASAGLVARACGGRLSAFYTSLGDAPLARSTTSSAPAPGPGAAVDDAALEAAIVQAARGFRDRLEEALVAEAGEAGAARLLARWREAFPATYRQSETVAQGIADLHLAERAIAAGRPRVHLCRPPGAGPRALTLRLASPDRPLPLSDALPLFESLDLRAIEEVPYRIEPAGGPAVVLHAYRLDARADAAEEVFPALTGALSALLDGAAEADGFNRLVLRAGLTGGNAGCCARCSAG
jgi:glutamate dehydrogenase